MTIKPIKTRPLTDKFMEDLKLKMKGNLKQTELADRLGTSKQYVNAWFSKKRFPCGETILKLQELIRTTFKMFL